MRLLLLFMSLLLSISVDAQRKPIANLPVVSVEEAGFIRDSIEDLVTKLRNLQQPDFRGLVVIKDNQIVVEEYFNSFWRNHIHDIRSAGKSITSILLGVAIKEGLVQSTEQNVYSFFSKEKYPNIHADYKRVKIKHLLDMSSGLDADSDDSDTPGNAGAWIAKDEWLNYLLGISLVAEPSSRWVYADINAALIGAIIEERSGMSLRDFAIEKLFTPLGIKEFYWYTNAANQTMASGNLYISTLDFAKIGTLLINQGRWGKRQIVDSDYVTQMLAHKVFNIVDYNPLADNYGMLWYKSQRTFGQKKAEYLWASGNGGNHLVVVPDENLVIALTSGAYGQWYPHKRAYAILGKVLNALK